MLKTGANALLALILHFFDRAVYKNIHLNDKRGLFFPLFGYVLGLTMDWHHIYYISGVNK